MIIVNAAMKGDEIVKAITALEGKNITFIKKEGLKHYFESPNETEDGAFIKTMLKKDPRFSTLYTAVEVK